MKAESADDRRFGLLPLFTAFPTLAAFVAQQYLVNPLSSHLTQTLAFPAEVSSQDECDCRVEKQPPTINLSHGQETQEEQLSSKLENSRV